MSVRSVALAVCLFGAGCSISADETARPVDDAPTDLLNPTTTTAPSPEVGDTYDLVLMFVNSSDRRVPVLRPQETPPTVQNVLDGLASQPTVEEQAAHTDNPITTRLLQSMAPTSSGVDNGVLRVTVEGPELREFATDTPESLALIYGQIVCSVVELEEAEVSLVEIFDTEGRIDALPDGGPVAPIEGPVGPVDYNNCATAAEIAEAEADVETEGSTETTEG
jgi:hypothetical protein